jgi:hypothetical protein
MVGGVVGLFLGFSQRQVDEQDLTRPNEGIRRSLRNSVRLFLIVGVVGGLLIALGMGMGALVYYLRASDGWQDFLTYHAHAYELDALIGLLDGLSVGLFIGFLAALRGWYAYIQHTVLRRQLQRAGAIPPRYERFLDFATDRILLQRIGGGYRFIHALLLDYFASLQKDDPGQLAVRGG